MYKYISKHMSNSFIVHGYEPREGYYDYDPYGD
jgi:hypothetical protein